MSNMVVSKEAFKAADNETKLLLIFDIISNQHTILVEHVKEQTKTCDSRGTQCNNRLNKLERRKLTDTSVAAGTGIIGGFLGVLLKPFLWGN